MSAPLWRKTRSKPAIRPGARLVTQISGSKARLRAARLFTPSPSATSRVTTTTAAIGRTIPPWRRNIPRKIANRPISVKLITASGADRRR